MELIDTIPQTIRVFLVENHTIVRAGIRALLNSISGIEVTGESGDGYDALLQLQQLDELDELPSVVLMDLALPGMGGLEATGRITAAYPQIKVLILTMHASEEYVLQALRAGASGYLIKDATPQEVQNAIRDALHGAIPLSPAVSRHVISDYVRRVGGNEGVGPGRPSMGPLTRRQREILTLIAEGFSTKEIASRLGLSVKTIETHRAALMERLNIHDIASLVKYAIRMGLSTTDD